MASDLPAPARLILLTLASLASWPGGRVPAEFSPSLTTLADKTGLARRAVMNHLNAVEKKDGIDGWVLRDRPEVAHARSKKERTQYQLSIPAGAPHALDEQEVRAPDALEKAASRASGAPVLASTRAPGAPGLGHEVPTIKPSSKSTSSSPRVRLRSAPALPSAREEEDGTKKSTNPNTTVVAISTALGISVAEALDVYGQITADHTVRSPSKFVATLIANGDIQRYRPRPVVEAKPVPRCTFTADPRDPSRCKHCHTPLRNRRHQEAA